MSLVHLTLTLRITDVTVTHHDRAGVLLQDGAIVSVGCILNMMIQCPRYTPHTDSRRLGVWSSLLSGQIQQELILRCYSA